MGVSSFRSRLSTFLVGAGIILLSLVSAPGASADDASDDVENFRYASWDVSYHLSLDAEGRAQAEVTEQLEAQFPEVDQNRGIIRSLPLRYQGAPAAPEDINVTDGSGNDVPFEIDNEEGFRSILVGDDNFVHGDQTYVISYTVDDVMHTTEEADEFYWDLVPVDRQQDINEVTAEITLDETLTSALTGESACYVGTPEDTQPCTIETGASDDSTLRVSETPLLAGQGLTVAIGVAPGTVVQPPERHDNFILDVLPLIFVGAAGLLAGGGALSVWAMVRRYRDDTSQPSIQHGIPEAMNPLIAKWVTGRGSDPIVATLLDLAVRGVLRIEETSKDTDLPNKKPEPKPMLRLLDPQLVTDPLEIQLLEGLFPDLAPGATFSFPKDSKVFTKAAQKVLQDSGQTVLDRGYQRKVRHRGAALAGWISLALLIPVVVLLIMGASRDNMPTLVISIVVGGLSLVLFFVCVMQHRVLTPQGAATRQQLERIRQMMAATETERLDMLQSFTHARRRQTSAVEPDRAEIIEVYDRLLPYAVLFGMQKDWSEVLTNAYQYYHFPFPFWYPALMTHGVDGMQSSLDSMLSSVSSAAATSSSGAGSTGGGVAGGGGGGGAAGGR